MHTDGSSAKVEQADKFMHKKCKVNAGKTVALSVLTALIVAPLAAGAAATAPAAALGWWTDAKFWGFLGAIAGWGMSLAAIKDAATSGPEIISPNMTFVMLIYSGLFAWWAWVVNPQNLLLCACHTANVLAQGNQVFPYTNCVLS